MRRSLLFIPANQPGMLQNADVFEADAVIFDLEDAVFASEKDAALELLNAFLDAIPLNKVEVMLRINGLDTEQGLIDLKHIVSEKIDTIMLPKANLDVLNSCSDILDELELNYQMLKRISIVPIIEDADACFHAYEIAKHPRVSGLLLGAEDLAKDLEVERTDASFEIFFARSQVIYAAKAHQKDAIDTPYISTKNEEGLILDAKYAKSLGMNAKACIHPNQIDIINEIFSPSKADIEQALRIIKAMDDPNNKEKGAFSLDGKMIDKPIIERALKTIEKAKKYQLI
ncbi:MAG: CoA ester lyase [Tenericutes bacterium HGW-Tenericutes-6]|nr:MAG: CoA ester lyase [Tenericutes bacterium HGW-Tenericutes-6]